jgi:hypothetical protein
MVITTKFDVFEKVGIVPLEGFPGRVFKIIQNGSDLWYDVDYWTEGQLKVVSLMECDLEKLKPQKRSSFMEARILNIGSKKYTQVECNDLPGAGNACHSYSVMTVPQTSENAIAVVAHVNFQNGPILEAGVNGCHNEDLIAIVIDRLQGFQSGDFKCRENAIALTKLEESLMWLRKRTIDREARGVEGKNII